MTYADEGLLGSYPVAERQILVRDMWTGITTTASVNSHGAPGDDWSCSGAISRDGHYVVFTSKAGNLVQPPRWKGDPVYGHNLRTGRARLLSVSSSGQMATPKWIYGFRPVAVSAAGRFIAFQAGAHNLIPNDTNNRADIFLRDRRGR